MVDDSTVRLTLSRPSRPMLGEFVEQPGMILSPTAIMKYNAYDDRTSDFGKNPVGSGPFKLEQLFIGSKLTFVRNDDYWREGYPYLDRIEFNIVSERSTRIALLRTGEADRLCRGKSPTRVMGICIT